MIGIFDSGIGGLTLIKKLLKLDPKIDFVYLGDTARTPYGTRSQKTVQRFARECTEFLINKGCDVIIVACNTATAQALPLLQKTYPDKHIVGVIIPGVEAAIQATKNNRIGVVGTQGTISSKAYERELQKLNPSCKVYNTPCPLLVPLIEEGWDQHHVTRKIVKIYTKPLKDVHIDTLILGCTHYPVIKRMFQEIMGKRVTVINPSKEAAKQLHRYLEKHPEVKVTKKSKQLYYVTDQTERFLKIGQRFLKSPILPLEHVHLPELKEVDE